jgi:hypothetical protein
VIAPFAESGKLQTLAGFGLLSEEGNAAKEQGGAGTTVQMSTAIAK